jgi:ADP-heptose:LPS heptosyltransferase
MGKMTANQGALRRSIDRKLRVGGRVITPSLGPEKSPFSISRLESIFAGDSKPNFCIIRSLGGIGDVLMTTPLCRGLKRKWPGCTVTYSTDMEYMDGALPDILKYNPYIDEIIPYQILKGKRFDAVTDVTSVAVNYEKAGNPAINRIDLFSHATGIPLFGEKLPTYIVTEEEKDWAKQFLTKYIQENINSKTKWIGVQARSNSEKRNWPIQNVKELITRLTALPNVKVIVFDYRKEEQWNLRNVIPIQNFKIRQVAALIEAVDLMICPDSGLLHIAGALEKRIVGLFGSTDPKARINYYNNAIVIENNSLQCLHCWYSPCDYKTACMKSITIDEVYNAALKQLEIPECRKNQISFSVPGEKAIVLKRDVGGIGDMIMVTPVLRGLRERFRDKQIHLMIPDQFKDIFKYNPYVDKIIPVNNTMYDYYEYKYDISSACAKYESELVKNKQPLEKTRVQVFCEVAGVSPSRYRPELFLSIEEVDWAKKFLASYSENIIIAIGIQAAESYRDWPIEYFHELFQKMEQENKKIKFLILGKERIWDFPYNNIIDAAGFPLRKYLSLVSQCQLVLTPDTSLLHVAGAFNKETIALFGPIDSRSRCKLYPKTVILQDKLECIPCWRNAYIPCKINHDLDKSVCMGNIKPEKVIELISKILNKEGE